jgi:hypothetical protein
MIARIVLAVVVGVVVFLVCTFVGGLLVTIAISWVAAVGSFLVKWASLLGLLAALWRFFGGGGFSITRT